MKKRIIGSLLCIMLVLPLASVSSVLAAENDSVVEIKVKGGLGLSIEVINVGDTAILADEGSKTMIEISAIPKLNELHERDYPFGGEWVYGPHYFGRRIFQDIMPNESYSCHFRLHRIFIGLKNRLRYLNKIQNTPNYFQDSIPYRGLRILEVKINVGTYNFDGGAYYQQHGYMELTVLQIGAFVIILDQ